MTKNKSSSPRTIGIQWNMYIFSGKGAFSVQYVFSGIGTFSVE